MSFLNSHRLSPALTLLLCWMAFAPVALAQPVIQLAGGYGHTVALLSNGTVMAWGRNDYGQLGLGNLTNQNTPQLIAGLTGVSSIAAGGAHTLALLSNGTVKAWGQSGYGQLGLGNTTTQNTPQLIPGLTGVSSIAAGGVHTLALLSNGTVKACGYNYYGQLGLGNNTIEYTTPQLIPGLTGVSSIEAGLQHTIAVLSNFTVKAWGWNGYGQLGLGNLNNQNTPQLIPGLTGVSSVAAGDAHSLAFLSNGTVKAWGHNLYTQLGLGNNTNQNTPQLIPGLTGVSSIAAGDFHSLALLSNGTVKAWGWNSSGQLGLGNITDQNTPQLIPSLTGVSRITAGGEHTLSLLSGFTVMAWGRHNYGQLGLGAFDGPFPTPQLIPGLGGVLAASTQHPLGSSLSFNVTYPNAPTPLYYLDISLSGNTPGIVVPGVGTIPLNAPLIYTDYGSMLPGFFSGFLGVLNATGNATASVFLPVNLPLAGQTIHGGGILIDPMAPTQIGAIFNGRTTLLVNPVPAALNITANTGPAYGGTVVSIGGSNFLPGASITFGGSAATNVSVQNNSIITCTTPAHVPGAVNVVITNPGPGTALTQTMTAAYTYVAPTISGITPASGFTLGGTAVVISGSGFGPSSTVSFGGTAATNVVVQNASVITCYTPTHSGGVVNVVVTQPVVGSVTLNSAFTYTYQSAPPTIAGITPTSGPSAGGTPVVITGTGFQSGATVTIGGAALSNVVISATSISGTTAAHALGVVGVVVTNPDTQSATAGGAFTYFSNLSLATLSPTVPTPGAVVTLTGDGFQSGLSMDVGGVPTVPTAVTQTQVLFVMPMGVACPTLVTVANPSGQTASLSFNTAPLINSLWPSVGPLAGGTTVLIAGANFVAGTTVNFGGLAATVLSTSPTGILVTVPPAAAGTAANTPVIVAVTNPSGCTGGSTYTYQ